ncbi:MAG: hypothetical protein KGZ50_03205 [Peptococcaceae bacterium]|jgi:hypothetical protein|nr:hypothetical protein [Peptococcaceae bacterium]
MFWQPYLMLMPAKISKRVAKMELRLCMEDAAGTVNITDIMLQGGTLATLWISHSSELKFSFEQ